ncbi:MAG: hypothetical protein COV08_01800 [Candidatus Vogelbacteria bacterium CG10_big_fil_rev_8_21_14_0_10_49_38]|uniref:Methyltransferase type 11 domain-containing protein n=1 Tax=Candidatus Vogelbacteria bacterium CG10_big_fil_rev_8_21_14_0_10_49_38 TaxID=1975043 RepID=A0A2H0RHW0_9BACT|nr:MAG: hypothetical protein BK006_01815 [bacterium CG10_49_38]PIR46047.1 MAG: hypothetical protein COV08_01800 [Candidatus Vogelbacteria bacterium CG10_big_fil_rev_8_21_14_0_10_49_38]
MNKSKDIAHLSSKQYSSAEKLLARWNLYDYSIPKIDIYKTALKMLSLKGNEDIFEAGCGNGDVLLGLRRNGYTGRLVGMDINDKMFNEAKKIQKQENLRPIEFKIGSADKLPFPDKSFDLIFAFFMLYHVPDINKTLIEWKRVLKDSGKILIATASSSNKPKHKIFKKLIEESVKETTSPQFSHFFNLENGEKQLAKVFKVTDKFIYKGKIKIKKPELYLKALDSIRDMFDPTIPISIWNKERNAIEAKIEKEIEKYGHFTDTVKRGFFICEK